MFNPGSEPHGAAVPACLSSPMDALGSSFRLDFRATCTTTRTPHTHEHTRSLNFCRTPWRQPRTLRCSLDPFLSCRLTRRPLRSLNLGSEQTWWQQVSMRSRRTCASMNSRECGRTFKRSHSDMLPGVIVNSRFRRSPWNLYQIPGLVGYDWIRWY